MMLNMATAQRRSAERKYRTKLYEWRDIRARIRLGKAYIETLKKDLAKSEEDLKCLTGVGFIVARVINPYHGGRFIVETGPKDKYIVDCNRKLDKEKIIAGTRVFLEEKSMTIMGILPSLVEPAVRNMFVKDPGNVTYDSLGGLSDQIQQVREWIELPLLNHEIFQTVGIKAPKGVLLYGPPGTGKTLLARAIANNVDATFLEIVGSALLSRFAGEGARLVRVLFKYARDHQPCIIFMDEIDVIGGRRLRSGTAIDREVQRTLVELFYQMDGFQELGKVKVIMATNRRDILDPALLRPGRLDKHIEIPLPGKQARMEILQIHAAGVATQGEIDYEAVVNLSEGFNCADLRNVCTEAGLSAIRAERDWVINEDFMKAVRRLIEAKKLESCTYYYY